MESEIKRWKEIFENIFGVYTEESWRSLFGIPIDTVNAMWKKLQPELHVAHHLLYAYYYHRSYASFAACAKTCGIGKTTFKSAVKEVLRLCNIKCSEVRQLSISCLCFNFVDTLEW